MRDLEVFQGIYQVASFCKPAQVKSLSSILKALISSCPRTASLQYKCRTQNTAGFLLSSSNMGRDFYSRWSLQSVLTREMMLSVHGPKVLINSANLHMPRGEAKHSTTQKAVNTASQDKWTSNSELKSICCISTWITPILLIILISLESPGLEDMALVNLHKIKGGSKGSLYAGNKLRADEQHIP